MKEFQIAIPSYERVAVLQSKTLATLDRIGVQPDRVTVFVADDQQLELYSKGIDNKWNIQVGRPGLFNCRRHYFTEHYEAGTPVLSMDDDIEKIEQLGDKNLIELDASGFESLCQYGFETCEEHQAPLWGIYPARNHFFMSNRAVVGLRYVIGCFFGSFAGNKIWTKERLSDESSAEDFETCLLSWFWFQSLLRVENVTVKTKYYASGGIDKEVEDAGAERWGVHENRLKQLAQHYPDQCSLVTKAGGRANLRLKSITHHKLKIGAF